MRLRSRRGPKVSALDEKRFEALGRKFVARFDFNAMCRVEDARDGRGFLEIAAPFLQRLDEADRADPAKAIAAARSLKFRDVRLILAEALRHAEPDIDEEDAGEIIGDIGLPAAMEVVAWAIVKAMGSDTDADADGGGDASPANPTTRKTRGASAKTG